MQQLHLNQIEILFWLFEKNVPEILSKIDKHVGKKVSTRPYYILDLAGQPKTLELTSVEKNLSIMISNNLKPRAQVQKASSKANSKTPLSLGSICYERHFTIHMLDLILSLQSQLGRLTRKQIKRRLKRYRKRATRVTSCLKNLSNPERLHNLGLATLERR